MTSSVEESNLFAEAQPAHVYEEAIDDTVPSTPIRVLGRYALVNPSEDDRHTLIERLQVRLMNERRFSSHFRCACARDMTSASMR